MLSANKTACLLHESALVKIMGKYVILCQNGLEIIFPWFFAVCVYIAVFSCGGGRDRPPCIPLRGADDGPGVGGLSAPGKGGLSAPGEGGLCAPGAQSARTMYIPWLWKHTYCVSQPPKQTFCLLKLHWHYAVLSLFGMYTLQHARITYLTNGWLTRCAE